MRKILSSILVLGTTSAIVVGLSSAFFSDTETSSGNVLQAGAVDLLVNDQDNPENIVNLTDLKPGDEEIVNKKLTVQNDSHVWLHLIEFTTGQGEQTEPEELEEETQWEGPKHDLENYLTYDLLIKRGGEELEGEVLINPNENIPFPDVFSCWIPLGEIPAGDSYVGQSFHFDPEVTNWAQGDRLEFSEEFYAVQSRNNPNPTPPPTESGRTWNPDTKTCEACDTELGWADEVIENNQGTLKNGNPITDPNRTDPEEALGPADWASGGSTGFFSLGEDGSIIVKFATLVVDEVGDDLSIHEATNGRSSYPEEKATVEISLDGSTWHEVGEASSEPAGVGDGDGVTYFDISSTPLSAFQYVRITDATDYGPHAGSADGFDLDAVDAQSACVQQEE